MPSFSMNRGVATSSVTVAVDPGNGTVDNQSFTVSAPSGKTVLSGGFDMGAFSNPGTFPQLVASRPTSDGTGWTFVFRNPSADYTRGVTLYVIYEDS